MRLSVIGCGYLGVVHVTSMAKLGHDVMGVDIDVHKTNLLSNGRAPFLGPRLEGLLTRSVEAGRLTFIQDFSAIKGVQVHFIGVGVLQFEPGTADMIYVDAAMTTTLLHLGYCISGPEVVAGKSAIPAGTAARLSQLIKSTGALLLWNPKFLREGFVIQDTLRLDRMVYGLPENPDAAGRAQETMDAVYVQTLAASTLRLVIDYTIAELIKTNVNTFPTTKISFINATSQVCDAAGANVTALTEMVGMDNRIECRLLCVGIGSDGSRLPKDTRAFQACTGESGVGDTLVFFTKVDRTSNTMRVGIIRTVVELLVEHTLTAVVMILRAAFKPDSDDMRNSPALDPTVELSGVVGWVVVHDPVAGPILTQRTNRPHEVAVPTQSALGEADLVIIGTEWREHQDLDPTQAVGLACNRYVIDGRNRLDAQA